MTSKFNLHLGDCLETLRCMADNSVDSVVCDPPYELTASKRTKPAPFVEGSPYSRHRVGVNGDNKPVGGFMGNEWDGTGIAFRVDLWAEVMRVLKPGAHLLAFSGTRTYHRMACAIEDAGFEIRDQIQWIFGSGFPKSRNISGDMTDAADAKSWSGWGTALKPANEPICVARKPLARGLTVAANVLEHGTGALNIDGCRVALVGGDQKSEGGANAGMSGTKFFGDMQIAGDNRDGLGRWPANLIHDGSDEVLAGFPDNNGSGSARKLNRGARPESDGWGMQDEPGALRDAGTGSAARFFYCPKASRADRNEGLTGSSTPAVSADATMRDCQTADWSTRNGNHHPTVKPTDLMAYLIRLVTPPGGVVLDPFMGSGSTGKAAMREGMRFIGCELSEDYVAIATARIQYELYLLDEARRAAEVVAPQLDLFAL